MANEFKNKNEFKEEFQRSIIERYGRSFEPVSYTHLYTLYGSIGNTHCSDYGCSLYAAAKQTACIWFHNGLAESACGVC